MRPLLLALLVGCAAPAAAQTATSTRDVRTAYGSRLDLPDLPGIGRGTTARLSTRVDNRINNRLSLRIARYTVRANDPVAAFHAVPDDGTRRAPLTQTTPMSEP